MIGKNSRKRHYLKKYIYKHGRYYWPNFDHAKRTFKDFIISSLGEYHHLYVKSDTLLLMDVFEKIQNMCLDIYELDPAHSLTALESAWLKKRAALEKNKVKLYLLSDADMLLMIVKKNRGGICHPVHWYAKANYKYMKGCDKNKELSYLKYWDVNNFYGWALSKKLQLGNFKWVEETFEFNGDFIKSYNDESDEWYFLEVELKLKLKILKI